MQTTTAVALPRDIDADLDAWLKPFLDVTGRKSRRKMAPLYVRGLLGSGERKSIQPMAERLGLPGHDQLHHFISSPAWDDAPLWRVLAEQADRQVGSADAVLMVDDTGLPKKGELSVGVAPQYCGAVGKTTNCQVLVSLTLARGEVPVPVGLQLFRIHTAEAAGDQGQGGGRRSPLLVEAEFLEGSHPARAADQVADLRLVAGLRDHALARASTAFACSSKSIVLGSKGSPTHWTISAWLSCFGSAIATRNSA